MNRDARSMNPATVHTATAAQLQALDVSRSIWASANAGTGKTDMLTRRLIALLLADTTLKPAHLLALTFSTAGAAEMAARLPRAVDTLLALDEAGLNAKLHTSLGLAPFDGARARLRTVAEQLAAEPPIIATFHGFAGRLLGSPGSGHTASTVLTSSAQKDLLHHAVHLALTDADAAVQHAVQTLLGQFHDSFWSEITHKLVMEWHVFERSLMGQFGVAETAAAVRQAMDLPDAPEPPDLVPDAATLGFFAAWAERTKPYLGGHTTTLHDNLVLFGQQPSPATWEKILYSSGEPRRSYVVPPKKHEPWPEFEHLFATALAFYEDLSQRHAAVQSYRLTHALLVWAEAVARAYRTLKQVRGVVDFQDMLDALSRNMQEEGPAFWQRLDHGIRHIVLDEGQDTNSQQADLIVQMVYELVAQPEPGTVRTLLAVGDLKQSIYRFQGAVPQTFLSLRDLLGSALAPPARTVALTASFRSAPAVLNLADAVFGSEAAAPLAHAVLGEAAPWPHHSSVFDGVPSHLELWPTDASEKPANAEPWALPAPQPAPTGGVARTAQRVTATITNLVNNGVVLACTGQPARYGDMLVLVQRREAGHAVAAALAAAGVPYLAVLKEAPLPQPVVDILNMLDVLADPMATLPWLRVLKGPWFGPFAGVNDDMVLNLAHAAEQDGIWPALPEHARSWATSLRQTMADHGLAFTLQKACTEVGLLNRVLAQTAVGPASAPTRLAEWQGWLDALVQLGRSQTNPVMLAEAIRAGELTPPPPVGDAVRILTVHGSKGLEAPVVFLPETQRTMSSLSQNDWLLWARNPDTRAPLFPLVRTGSSEHPLKTRLEDEEKAAKKADSLRLLYVAITRAKERIYIGGFGKPSDDTWYALLEPALRSLGACEQDDGRLVLRVGEAVHSAPAAAPLPLALPGWLTAPVQAAPPPVVLPDTPEQALGHAIHNALEQVLRQPNRADEVLAGLPEEIATEVQQVLTTHAPLFDVRTALWHGVEAELAVQGAAGFSLGRADWVKVNAETIWILDFKTARTVPAEVPDAYARQLQGYGAALAATYPGHTVRLGVLWTVTASLHEVPYSACQTAPQA